MRALAMLGSDLYVGGGFTTAGGVLAKGIAKWNGSIWTALGSGMDGRGYPDVYALAVSGSDLYAGGDFTSAGGKVSPYLAKAIIYPLAFDRLIVSNGTFRALLTGSESNSVVVEGSATFADWIPLATNILPASGWELTLPVGTNARQFYRARLAP